MISIARRRGVRIVLKVKGVFGLGRKRGVRDGTGREVGGIERGHLRVEACEAVRGGVKSRREVSNSASRLKVAEASEEQK